MKSVFALIVIMLFVGCSTRNKYDVADYISGEERDSLLTGVIAHVYTAPVYVLMKDRLNPEHRRYYASLIPDFSINQYFISENGTHYFYVIRPGSKSGDTRAVGGSFRVGHNYQLSGFREVFVTPVLPKEELTNRCGFLFDEMVKGTIGPYLKMKTYVQWPNEVTAYDTMTYEWKLVPEKIQ